MTVLRTITRVAAAFAVAAAGLAGSSAAPAGADPGACTTSTGVVVVVDFRPFGGGIKRGCDANPTTGFAALHNAGFPTVGTQRDGPGFVCRISGLPTADADPCVVTPPASRYWSYWHADPGQSSWSYSQLGATSYHPKAGSVDAWVYGATDTGGTSGGPSFSVSSVRATDPAPAPAPAPAPSSSAPAAGGGSGSGGSGSNGSGSNGSGSSGTSGSRSSGGASSAPSSPKATGSAAPQPKASTTAGQPDPAAASTTAATPDATTSASATDPATSATTSVAAVPSATVSSDAPVTDVRAAPVSAEPAQGSAWPLVGGLALLAALGGTVSVVALRRRSSEG